MIFRHSVLSAAHCLSTSNFFVSVGHGSDDNKAVDCPPSHQKKHPSYSSIYLSNDIAVLNIEKKIKFSVNVFPAALPSRMPVNNRPSTVCGWGSTSYPSLNYPTEMQCADNQILDATNCIQYYGTQIKPGMVCATSITYEQDACIGDSGGPLFDWFSYVIDSHGCVHEEVVGIVSWGNGCGTAPGVYTDVFFFKDWIKRTAQECLFCEGIQSREDGKCIVDEENS
ncbi:Oidioi.mRNA.OKI2018_I69.chr2.g5440.t1.cds [Oikopleura dioica]|uniref:Oidioi.mRNA.OKI2018_I69.chr2.g5440.t1.cds n=1 Tax=Oikopleura dioica TaxID=34765 RepID=A0ABN7T6X5_OIKDI|nr:Oidioi.mRNA.OKI2018_I69.chr2.g5440.t1.cds [Oikopleura dioica]